MRIAVFKISLQLNSLELTLIMDESPILLNRLFVRKKIFENEGDTDFIEPGRFDFCPLLHSCGVYPPLAINGVARPSKLVLLRKLSILLSVGIDMDSGLEASNVSFVHLPCEANVNFGGGGAESDVSKIVAKSVV